jgi:hypothetical protein
METKSSAFVSWKYLFRKPSDFILSIFVHCKKSEDYTPLESGSIERVSLKVYLTFRWLHALIMYYNYFYNEAHEANLTLNTL